MRFIFLLISLFFTLTASANEAMKYYEQALNHLHAGKLSAAEIAVKNSLKLDLNYLPARLLLGKVLLQTGKYQAAEKEFEQSLQLHADSFAVVISLVEVKLLLNKSQQALELLANHPQLKSESKYHYFQANAYKALTQYKQSLSAYQLAIVMEPDSAEIHTALADLWYKQESIISAQKEIQQALSLDSNYVPALLLSSEINKSLEQYEQAAQAIKQVLTIDKTNKQAMFAKAGLLLSQNKLPAALAIALKLRELAPNDPYAKLLHSSIVAQQGKSKQSRRLLTDIRQQLSGVSERNQEDQQVLLLSATVDFVNTNNLSARNKFSRYIELYGENSNARRYLAILSFRAQKFEKAQQHIEKALALNTYNVDLYILAAEIYRQGDLKSKQLAILAKAHGNFSSNEKVRQHYVASLLDHELFDEALAVLDKTNPNTSLQNKTILAFMQLKSGLYEQAKITTQALLDEYPGKVEVLQLAAELTLKTEEDRQKAVYFLEEALVLEDSFTPALTALAGIYLQQGNLIKVEQYYKKLLTINATDALTLQLYADLAIKQDRLVLAMKLLEPLANNNDYRNGRALINLYIVTKQADLALTLIKQLEKEYPLDEALLLSKSRIQAQLGQDALAMRTLKILYGLIYDDSDKLATLAHAQLDILDVVSANKSIDRIKKLEAAQVPEYLQARYYFMDKEPTRSLKLIDSALNEYPDNRVWLTLKVRVLISQQKLSDATTILSNLYKKQKNRNDMQMLAQLYGQQLQMEPLISLLKGWIKQSPNDDWARAQLSAVALSEGNQQLAIDVLEQSPTLDENPIFLNNLAHYFLDIHFQQKEAGISTAASYDKTLTKALTYAKTAYKLAPNIAAINDTLGWIYVHKDQVNNGLSLLREASARDATSGEIYYHLAYALAELNNIQQAKSALAKAITLAPAHTLRSSVTAKVNN
ncbi:XrtA/PEP-CTERM system TPR-repeat protein PrsT [Colwellia sp. 75C3]|uniref:XrtA/PEP-CTERM system TPR-repeat protein PrsT n=1 Tax=Colwellia sp. 75C3 TaxID=888425 RepID=UPI0012FF1BB9|nr:XrtA/PEP-CTERM system TPR-repeat protein PrsT [Colwellia sp. 75C3]